MIDRRGMVAGGAPIKVYLKPAEEAEFSRTSADLRRRFDLPEEPFRYDRLSNTLRVTGLSGSIRVGRYILEIKPDFLAQEPRWRLAFLHGVVHRENIDWVPRLKASHERRSLADIFGVVIDHALLRAINDGVPRTYSESLVVGTSVRGQFAPAHAWRRAIDPGAIACRVSRLDQDNSVLSLLKWAAGQLAVLAEINWLRTELEQFEYIWPEAQAAHPSLNVVESLTVPPQFGFLDDGIAVAKIISRRPQVGLGESASQALVWCNRELEPHHARVQELMAEAPPVERVRHRSIQ